MRVAAHISCFLADRKILPRTRRCMSRAKAFSTLRVTRTFLHMLTQGKSRPNT